MHPDSSPGKLVNPESVQASKYMIAFHKEGDEDVIEKFIGIVRVKNQTGLSSLWMRLAA